MLIRGMLARLCRGLARVGLGFGEHLAALADRLEGRAPAEDAAKGIGA